MVSILDQKTPVRWRFPEIRELYSLDDLTRGFIITDNRRSSRRADTGVAHLLAACTSATFISDQPLDPANILAYVFPHESPGRFATLAVWGETLPVHYVPAWQKALPEVFYSKASLLEEKAIRGLHEVMEPLYQSLPLEPAGSGHTRLSLVVAPVIPADFQRSARRINEALAVANPPLDPDLCIQFASIGAELSPSVPEAPMFVIYLTPLAATPDELDALAQGSDVDPKFLPAAPPQERVSVKLALKAGGEPSKESVDD